VAVGLVVEAMAAAVDMVVEVMVAAVATVVGSEAAVVAGPRGGGRGGGHGGSKAVVVPHKHAGIFISKSKEEALCTKTMFPREFVYGEKRVSVLAVVLHKHANVFISNSTVSNVKNITKTENFRQSTATNGKGNLVDVNSETNRRSVCWNRGALGRSTSRTDGDRR
jgi:hypothetical protein